MAIAAVLFSAVFFFFCLFFEAYKPGSSLLSFEVRIRA